MELLKAIYFSVFLTNQLILFEIVQVLCHCLPNKACIVWSLKHKAIMLPSAHVTPKKT